MNSKMLVAAGLLSAALAAPAMAQGVAAPRFSVEPYVGYGFFGELPETETTLESAVAYGGRAAFQLSPQWAVFGNYQRSQPKVEKGLSLFRDAEATVDHWSGGIEFSYVPRGGAEGMLPIVLEAGLGQARYDGFASGQTESDVAVKLGLSSALQLTPRFGIRYGADDYISNFRDDGIVNQIFARAGVEISF